MFPFLQSSIDDTSIVVHPESFVNKTVDNLWGISTIKIGRGEEELDGD